MRRAVAHAERGGGFWGVGAWLGWAGVSLVLLLGARVAEAQTALPYAPQDGDIVWHTSTSRQSEAIAAATGSTLTHVGLIFWHDDAWQVLEAVQPVRWTPLDTWIARGADNSLLAMRLRPNAHPHPDWATALRTAAEHYLGRDYDLVFAWGDDQIYCSELVYLAFTTGLSLELHPLEHFADLNLTAPLVQALIERRTTDGIDPQAPIITPVALTRSPLLEVVYGGGLE